jgi:PhzF family phenazine biosynthesis protein
LAALQTRSEGPGFLKQLRLLHIDAFTDRPFRGNPAAVCLLDRERDAGWMQSVGAEMNLAETAFLLARPDGWSLRWFTPTVEMDLCGHATLASAHALWSESLLDPNEMVRFHTKSGLLTATRLDNDWIELNFPVTPDSKSDAPAGLLESLGVTKPKYVGRTKFDYIVEVDSEEALRALKPDYVGLRQISARGVIVTSRANGQYDFVSRFFAPAVGIDEDPVTGSAHCCLTPYWAARLGKTELVAYQASPRGGHLRVRLDGDRVMLAGRAVTVFRGRLDV